MGRFAKAKIASYLDQVESSALDLVPIIEAVCENALLPKSEQSEPTDARDYVILALYNYFKAARALRDCKESNATLEEILSPKAD